MKTLFQKVADQWNHFFFRPISTATIGIFRIFFGLVVFVSMLGKFPYRELFYGANGIVTVQTMDRYFPGPDFFYFRWVPDSDPGLMIYFLAILISCLSLAIGFKSRWSSILVFLGIISLSNRNFFVDNSGDDIMRINAFFLMFSECGAAYSVDRWLRVRRGGEVTIPHRAPWAQRLLQLQLAYLYLNTAYLKGGAWFDGTALYYALNYLELKRFTLKPFFYFFWQIKVMTYLVMIAEFAAGSLIWFRRLRYPILIAAFLLHWGINLTMQFPVFQYAMMVSLINFVFPEDMERWVNRLKLKLRMVPDVHTA